MSNHAPIQTSITSFIDNNEGTVIPVGASNKNYSVADLRFADGYSDVDGDVGGIAITSVDSSKGILWYSTDTGSTWSKVLGVSASHALLLGATTNNLLYYQAVQTLTNANYNGTNNAVFTYRAWDQTTGVNGGFADTSVNGGASAFSVTERVVGGVILDVNDEPTLTLATTESHINHSLPVKLFNNINAGAGADDSGANALIKQIVLNVMGIKNGSAEIITISGVDIPLVQTGAGFIALPNNAKCKVAGTATTLTLTLINDAGWTATGINNQVNQMLDSVTYKNVYVTSSVVGIEGERAITVRSMTDLGVQSTSNNVYAPKNSATFSNLISKVIIDKTAPNAPITVTVPENDGVGITPIEAQNGTEVVVSLVGTNALEGDVIRVVVQNLAPIQYTLLGTDILNNSASVTIPQAILQSVGQGTALVAVTITDSANNTSVPSTVTINIITQNTAPTGAPVISGTPTQGQVLTASSGTLADIDGLGTLSYKWYANGTEISGATASTLTLTQAQVSKTITVSASYTDGLGKLETVSSVATAAVANVNDLPTGVPTITGTARQGQVLTASSTGIADLDGLGTISYKWYANGTEIVGVTGSTLTLTQAQVGNAITVKAGYTDGFGALESVTSVATAIVLDVNDAPSATSGTITVLEDGTKTFAAADFGFTDVDGNTLSAVIISTLPAAGTLKLSGVAVTAGQSIPVASIGNLVYAPAANANGAGYANIGFKVKDNGGVANGGVDTSAAATLTINVTPVNDAPVFATDVTRNTLEDTTFEEQVSSLLAGKFTDVDSAGIAGIGINWDFATGHGATGVWYWADSSKTSWTAINKPDYGPSTSIFLKTTDYLRFVPALNADTSTQQGNLVVRVADDSMPTTASGSILNLTGLLANYWSVGEHSIIVNLTPVNDAPTLVTQIPDQTAVMGSAFSYTMPANTFADIDSTLTYSATRGDGTALPAWMTFNATTRAFTGTPNSTTDFNVKVIASDGALSVSDTFHVGIAPIVNNVAITSATGIQNSTLNANDVVTASVTFSELVNVTGVPKLALNIGGTTVYADYTSGTGTSTLTFNYTILASQNDANGISVDANALSLNAGTIKDAAGNNAILTTSLIADNAGYVVDNSAPILMGSNPSDNGYLMGVGNNLILNFNESVVKGTGTIAIYKSSDNSLVESFDAASSSLVTGWNGSTLTINPTANLLAATGYYIKIAPTAVKDLAGNAYAGIADATTLNFTTSNADGSLNLGTGYQFGTTGESELGWSASSAGDVNGDGYEDMIIGARTDTYLGGNSYKGSAYVVYGNAAGAGASSPSTSIAASLGFKIMGDASGLCFGNDVAGLGDVNGDGLDDVLVSAMNVGTGTGSSGYAYVIYGTKTGTSFDVTNIVDSQGFKITSASSVGKSAKGVGDINGDGIADMTLGSYGNVTYVIYGSSQTGALSLGASSIAQNRGFIIQADAVELTSISGAGDVNGDGLADLIIGENDYNGSTGGADVFVVYGTQGTTTNLLDLRGGTIASSLGFKITGGATGTEMGGNVASAGDVNGDGLADIAVTNKNSVFVLYSTTSATSSTLSLATDSVNASQGFKITGPTTNGRLGRITTQISSIGDMNGDGLADLLVGDTYYNQDAYVVYGNATGASVNLSAGTIASSQGFKIDCSGHDFVAAATTAGDINGDGLNDLIVTDYGQSGLAGVYYIILGGTQWITNAVNFTGTTAAEAVLGSAGDDTLIGGGGIDRFYAGKGDDTIVLSSTDVSNLANNVVASTKAFVIGGTGFDTAQLTGGANLNLTSISNVGAVGLTLDSRIESIERIDMRNDSSANTLSISAKDVADMAGMNLFHTGSASADGKTWTNVTGTALSATTKFHQLVVDGSASDVVNFTSEAGWTNAGTVNNGTSNYTAWQNTAKNSQILIQSGVTVVTPLSLALASDTGTSASDFITKNGTMNVNLSVSTDTWSYSTDSGTTWATGSGTSFVVGAGSYTANAVQVRENGAGGQTVAKLANALTVDMAAPTVAVTLPAGAVNGPKTVTFTFSEAVAGFTNADVSVANGTLSNVTTSNNVVWTATYTPTIGVTAASNVISVTSNSYTDVAGNNGAAGQVSFNLDTSLNGATRTSDGAGVGLTGMTNGVWNSVRVYAYYNPLFVDGTVTVYRGATVVGTHTITAGDSGSYAAYLSPYTNSNGGLWTITSGQTGVYSVALTYNGVTKTLPQMYNVGMSTSSNYLSPLVLDLNGDGVQTADISESVVFDLSGTGKKQVTSWVDRHDGLLAIDLNGDGQINSGTELLGSGTQLANGNKAADGWQALTQHDTNMDGHINAADAVFSQLRVWVDANGDGVTDAGELRTMDDVGIVGINLAADDAMVAQNGNYLRGFSSYTTKDGMTHEIVDAWFQTVTTATSVSGNGVSEEGEVRSLADTDLAVMNLNSDGVQIIPAAGVTETGRSPAELSSGLSMPVADVAFDYVSAAPEFVLTGLIVDVLI